VGLWVERQGFIFHGNDCRLRRCRLCFWVYYAFRVKFQNLRFRVNGT